VLYELSYFSNFSNKPIKVIVFNYDITTY